MPDTAALLQEAYQKIENGQLSEARTILQPLLTQDSQNADVWWLATHAAENPDEGKAALEKVLAIAPNYPGAQELKNHFQGAGLAEKPGLKPLAKLPPTATIPETDDDDEFDFEETSTTPRRRWWLWAAIAIIVILLFGLIFVVLNMSNQPVVTPTAVAQGETPTIGAQSADADATATALVELAQFDATATQIVMDATATAEQVEFDATSTALASEPTDTIPTEETSTETPESTEPTPTLDETVDPSSTEVVEPSPTLEELPLVGTPDNGVEATPTSEIESGNPYNGLVETLSDYAVTVEQIHVVATTLGNTLVVDACGVPGPESAQLLNNIMEGLVSQIATYDPNVQALGVNITDCSAEALPRIVAVPIGTAGAYARQEISQREFQRLWQPVR